MQFFKLASLIAISVGLVTAHPGEVHARASDAELAREAVWNAAQKRSLLARNCAASIEAFKAKRMAKRGSSFKKRQTTSTAAAPHVTQITDDTCITAPEVTEGPYYINNEYIRTDLTETQPGVDLVLDVGVVDTTTCEPLSNVFVELWAANSTGAYGGYSGRTSTVHVDTFLRGGYFTNDEGIVEITTIYPGFYQGRTAHIHTMVHKNWEKNSNGTLISHSGSLLHIGQFFFEETWNDEVFSTAPYTSNTQSRTLNSQDSILTQQQGNGNNAFLSLEYLDGDISNGLLGYITLGVDSTASYSINNGNSL